MRMGPSCTGPDTLDDLTRSCSSASFEKRVPGSLERFRPGLRVRSFCPQPVGRMCNFKRSKRACLSAPGSSENYFRLRSRSAQKEMHAAEECPEFPSICAS